MQIEPKMSASQERQRIINKLDRILQLLEAPIDTPVCNHGVMTPEGSGRTTCDLCGKVLTEVIEFSDSTTPLACQHTEVTFDSTRKSMCDQCGQEVYPIPSFTVTGGGHAYTTAENL
jgi:hypothetical protein